MELQFCSASAYLDIYAEELEAMSSNTQKNL
jgi:hypothetical protein